jgi:hypothetical protein
MFNHLVNDFSELTDSQIEEKTIELGRKYWMTNNPDVRGQISVVLEMYKDEARVRRAIAYQRQTENNGDLGLDSLINIS